MPGKFDPTSHHRRSIRLKGFDYTQPGVYFATMCTYQREAILGEIVAGEMQLNRLGRIAQQEWSRLPTRFPFLELGPFVIMPNHLHGILIITCRGTAENLTDSGSNETRRAPTREQFGNPVAGSIPTIIRSYKASVSWRINRLRVRPAHPFWQRNYYERVVRDNAELNRIEEYVIDNPRRWEEDRLNPHWFPK